MTTLSIIVCTYNRRPLLKNGLDALIPQMDAFADSTEVIVVDNNCTDGTREFVLDLCSNHSWLRYLHEQKQGLSNARNAAIEIAKGEYLCFLDDDAKPPPEYLRSLHEVIDKHQPDIFGGPIYPYYTTPKPPWFPESLETRRYAAQSGFAQCPISGGNFIIRADLLRKLGLFSPHLGMVGTKVRLGEERAVLEKYRRVVPPAQQRVFYSLESFVYHHVPKKKMSVRYIVRRGFASGRMSVVVKRERPSHLPFLTKKFFRICFAELPRLLWRRSPEAEHPVVAIQRAAVVAGKISRHLQMRLARAVPGRNAPCG